MKVCYPPIFYYDGDGHVRLIDSSLLLKLIPDAADGKILTSDPNGVAAWENAPSGTVPNSGLNALNILRGDGAGAWSVVNGGLAQILTKTDDYNVQTTDFSKTIRVNSALDKTQSLPSVGDGDDGARITFIRLGVGRVTVAAADSDKFYEGADGGTIYNESEIGASITLEYVDVIAMWAIVAASGAWNIT